LTLTAFFIFRNKAVSKKEKLHGFFALYLFYFKKKGKERVT